MVFQLDTTSPTELSEYYDMLKKTVWRVKVQRFGRNKREEVYTGVCIEKTGLIMTTFFNNVGTGGNVTLDSASGKSEEAILVDGKCGDGLALVKVRNPGEYDYVDFSPQRRFDAGQKLFSFVFPKVAHSPNLLEGDLSFQHHPNDEPDEPNLTFLPPHRTFSELFDINKFVARRNFDVRVGKLDDTTSFLQIGRLRATANYQGDKNKTEFGLEEGRGAPVFDNRGRLVGLVAFQSDGFDFAIHVDHLRLFYTTNMQKG